MAVNYAWILLRCFGKMHRQAESPVDPRGRLNNCAPAFLRLLASDLQVVVPGWAGFVEGWKESLLALPPTQVRWRSEQSNALPRAPERNDSPLPHQRLQAKPSPAVGAPLQVAASVCVLPDGNCPDSLDAVTDEAWLEEIYCGICAAGPWHKKRSFFQRVIRKHDVRNTLNSKTCPMCQRVFTEVSACRRHVQHQSCEAIVNNHGAAGAIAGLMQRARAIAEQQAPHSAPSDGRAGLHGAFSGNGGDSFGHQVEASSLRCLQQQWQPRPAGQAADPSNANAYEGGQSTRSRPSRAGSLELPHLLAQQRERARQAALDSNAEVEVSSAGIRPPPSRSSEVDGRGHSGASASSGH